MKIPEASIRLVCENYFEYKNDKITSSSDVLSFLKVYLKDFEREIFGVINVKANGDPINFNVVSIGELQSTVVHPREVLKSAILSNAAAIIIFHNHPSGDPTPSEEDIKTTKRLKEACSIMGIKLLDHIIVGAGGEKYKSVMEFI